MEPAAITCDRKNALISALQRRMRSYAQDGKLLLLTGLLISIGCSVLPS